MVGLLLHSTMADTIGNKKGEDVPMVHFMKELRQDSLFFDRLVDLVPPKFYFASAPEEGSSKYRHGVGSKAEAKRAAKEKSKKAKRLRLDPEAVKSTLEVQIEAEEEERRQKEEGEKSGDDDEEEGAEGVGDDSMDEDGGLTGGEAMMSGLEEEKSKEGGERGNVDFFGNAVDGQRASSYADLRKRLQQRLAALRSKRNADVAQKARDWRANQQGGKGRLALHAAKAKGGEDAIGKVKGKGKGKDKKKRLGDAGAGGGKGGGEKVGGDKSAGGKEGGIELQLEFGKVRIAEEGEEAARKKRKEKKEGKKKASTQQLLAKAAELQKKIHAGHSADGSSLKEAKTHAWSSAASRAAGVKVLDDPKLLKKSLKRQQKAKEKNSKKWEERKKTERELGAAKQQKRKDNIEQRKETKKSKKVEKREKKLMRPGFEGRAGAKPLNLSSS